MSSRSTELGIAPARARWPWVAFDLFLLTAAVGMALVRINDESVLTQVPFVLAFSIFGFVGALILSRDPRNRIGGMLLWSAAVTALSFVGGELTTWAIGQGRFNGLAVAGGLMSTFGWLFGILPVLFLLPLLFPDGHLPSPRWRWHVRSVVALLALLTFTFLFGQDELTGSTELAVPNPFFRESVGRLLDHLPNLDWVIGTLFPILFGASVLALFLRFRRASGVERQQIRWVMFGITLSFVGIVVGGFINDPVLNAIIQGPAFFVFPASIGIAVLRFHLYDLDVVVKKTVVYGAFAVFVTLVYLAVVVLLGATVGRGSSFLTMVAAVVVAVTFQPVRGMLTRFANRLVYGERATPYEVLAEFSERVGGTYADVDVLPRMARVLGEGVGAERADVWLAVDHELRDVATWPSEGERRAPVALANGELPSIEDGARVWAVEQAGELLGALAIRKPQSDPVSSADEKLVADLAGQAGLMLRNVRLTEELRARLDDLRAAQKRLVSAQDLERRRLERNIHDGAQQQLVALQVRQRLAEQLVERDPARAKELLTDLQADTATALEDLRDLARGIYPPLLADRGLVAAVDAQSRRSALPVEVRAEPIARYPQEVEAAVYFSVLEALQNAAKYSDAAHVVVTIVATDAALSFEVRDDGRGFDPVRTGHGTGLQGIADRLGALEGAMQVRAAPGEGAAIGGSIPTTPLDGEAGAGR